MKEVSIVAATFYGNRGAEAMLSTTIGSLRECYGTDLTFNVFSYYPTRDRDLVKDPRINIYSSTPTYLVSVLIPCALVLRILKFCGTKGLNRFSPRSVQALKRSNVLVCLAGVSFVEGRTKFLPFNIATILPAMLLNVPVVKFAQAMGPFKSFLNRLAAKLFLSRCRQVFARGEKTYFHVRQLFGNQGNCQRADDVAFLFKSDYCLTSGAEDFEQQLTALERLRQNGKKVVGVCPSSVIAKSAQGEGWSYEERMGELIACLVDSGFIVALYPHATRGEDLDKLHNNDLPLVKSVLEGLKPDVRKSVISFSGSLNAGQIQQIINACEVHVVSRFHAMVASLASGVPVIVIGWSHKYLEVMERFSQQDMVLDYRKEGVNPVVSRVKQLINEREQRSDIIKDVLPHVKNLASQQIWYVVDLLKRKNEYRIN